MVTLELIQKLREKTGLGIMDCKKALVETNGDVEKAIEILRKKGSLVAEKRSMNKTSQGIVHAYIHPGAQIGVLLELNCETDFVARTDSVKELAHGICMHVACMNPKFLSPEFVDEKFMEKELEIAREQLIQEKKPANIIENILEGKKKRIYSEQCLMQQNYIKNEKMTIEELVKETIAKVGENIKVRAFKRYEIGSC